jgi:exopolyphosphatase/guanosine-5'-triphosphate,3'-diphosphate pyrophosphatase
VEVVAMGGDVRFAAAQLLNEWDQDTLARIPLAELTRFTDRMLRFSEDELVQKYHIHVTDAETVGPALLTYVQLARAFQLDHVLVTDANLRDGLLTEMASKSAWTEEFSQQIIRSALDLGRKFGFDEPHAVHVAELSRKLFRELADEHHLPARYEIVLVIAALLHEIGLFVSNRSYHKHSMYLIRNSELFGLSKTDLLLVALAARYHRRASPLPSHEGYATLDREQRVAVAKLSAILRVAVALDESRSQRITDVRCGDDDGRMVITVPGVEDLSLEQLALNQNVTLFEETYGMPVLLRRGRRQP